MTITKRMKLKILGKNVICVERSGRFTLNRLLFGRAARSVAIGLVLAAKAQIKMLLVNFIVKNVKIYPLFFFC